MLTSELTASDVLKLCRFSVKASRLGREGLAYWLTAFEIETIADLSERYLLMRDAALISADERVMLDECLAVLDEAAPRRAAA